MKIEKVLFVSLGCSKNQYDLEVIISSFLGSKNYEVTLNENEARPKSLSSNIEVHATAAMAAAAERVNKIALEIMILDFMILFF